jgi:hypothetical protein
MFGVLPTAPFPLEVARRRLLLNARSIQAGASKAGSGIRRSDRLWTSEESRWPSRSTPAVTLCRHTDPGL